MPALLLGFVAPPAPPPALAPPKPPNSPKISPGPVTQARPITGGSYPRLKPTFPTTPSGGIPPGGGGIGNGSIPAAAGGAAGLSLPAVALAFALAIPQVLLFDSPAGMNYYDLHPPEPPQTLEPPIVPFTGGQGVGVAYRVTCEYDLWYRGGSGTRYDVHAVANFDVYGPVVGIVNERPPNLGPSPQPAHRSLEAKDAQGNKKLDYLVSWSGDDQYTNFKITRIVRPGDLADPFGNPPPTNTPIYSLPGNPVGVPQPLPPTLAPLPVPNAPLLGSPSGSASGSPSGSPLPAPIPDLPNNPLPILPAPQIEPDFFPTVDPSPTPGIGTGAPSPAPIPGMPIIREPTIVNPRPSVPSLPLVGNPLIPHPLPTPDPFTPNILQPNPLGPSPFTPNPNTGNPEPQPLPTTPAPTTPAPTTNPIDDIRETINRYLGPIAVIVAGITPLVQPERLREAAEAGSCRSFAPGGCNAPIANNAQNAANNSANNNLLLQQLMALLQVIQNLFLIPIKAGVELVNTKLGPLMSGINGIGGFLTRTAEAAKIDKVLGAMNTVLLLHNAAMLSRNLGSTLGDLTSSALTTIGIKDSEGSPIDVNSILGKQANSFMESLVGAEVWAGTKTSWHKASAIISSATNIMYTVRSMFDSTREILEWTAENTGKIGNALKRFRVVGENAYKWLPERVTVQNRFTRQIDRIREGTDSLDDAASSLSGVLGEVQSIQQEYADLQEQKQKFDKNIKDLTPKPREENKPVADAAVVALSASKAPSGIESVFRGEGETNA